MLAPANAKVHILVPGDVNDLHKSIKITTHHEVKRLDSLIQTSRQETIVVSPASYDPATRLVTMGAYREHLLRRLGFDKCSPELLREAIEYSIPLFLSNFLHLHGIKSAAERMPGEAENPSEVEPGRNSVRPFPGVHVISRVAARLLSLNEPLSLKKLDEDQLFASLPQVSRHFAQLKQVRCHECNVWDGRDGSIYPEPWDIGYCSENHFFRSLALLTCENIHTFDFPRSRINLHTGINARRR